MTNQTSTRWAGLTALRSVTIAAITVLSMSLLAGCGGGVEDDDTNGGARIRLLNATTDVAALDLRADDDVTASAVATDTISGYSGLDNDTYDLELTAPGSTTVLASIERSLDRDKSYTAVAWGEAGAVRLTFLGEDEDEDNIDDGKARLRVLNAATGAGSLDVYVTTPAIDLASTSADVSGAVTGVLGNYSEVDAGTFRVRITGAGDADDLRLDLPAITLDERTFVTLIVTPGPGGVLVHAMFLEQQSDLRVQKNPQARVRLIAGVAENASVAGNAGSVALSGGAISPSVGLYTLVDAGTQALSVQVNDGALSDTTQNFVGGGDYTVLVYGTPDDVITTVLDDDNRLPTSTSQAKMRLVHATQASATLSLTVGFVAVAENVPFGTGSEGSTVDSNSAARLDVTSPLSADPLFSAIDVDIQALGVYTVFMLDGRETPAGVLRRDR